MDREYIPEQGFPIDGQTFAQHREGCAQCAQYDEAVPSTLALLCLDGAILMKADNAKPVTRGPVVRDEFRVGTKAAKAAMRYKE